MFPAASMVGQIAMKLEFTIAGGFIAGMLAGIYVQHRWPIGNWHREFSGRPIASQTSISELARIPAPRRLVLLCMGQSNAANYGETRRQAGPGTYAFANGQLYEASDPLPGADGFRGSIWTRLAAKGIVAGRLDAVVVAVIAKGSARASEWLPGGSCYDPLTRTLDGLQSNQLAPDYILWQQGEQEAGDPTVAGKSYAHEVVEVARRCREYFPNTPFFVARATFGSFVNEQVREAQLRLAAMPGFAAGPDCDALGANYRTDGFHFNDQGLSAAADLWWEKLSAYRSSHPPAR